MARTCTSCGAGFFGAAAERGWTCQHCGSVHPPDAAADTVFLGNASPIPKPWEVPEPGPGQLVTSDLPCLQCGYSLKGLTSEMACPECGRRVAESMKGDLLEFAGEAELTRLYRGVLLVEYALVMSAVWWVIGDLAIGALGALAGTGEVVRWLASVASYADPLVMLLLMAQLVLGWWLIAAPDPARVEGPAEKDTGRRVRGALRLVLLAMATLQVLSFAFVFVPPYAAAMASLGDVPLPMALGADRLIGGVPRVLTGWDLAYSGLATAHTLGVVALAITSMLYLRTLAPRVPSRALARMALQMSWLGPVLSTFGIFLCGFGPLIGLVMTVVTLEMLGAPLKEMRKRRLEDAALREAIERELA